jgi:hypothetical protein
MRLIGGPYEIDYTDQRGQTREGPAWGTRYQAERNVERLLAAGNGPVTLRPWNADALAAIGARVPGLEARA